MTAYAILHNMVGPHFAGEIVEIEDGRLDIERLLDLDAIREATDDEAAACTPYGQGTQSVPRPFPPVPFQPPVEDVATDDAVSTPESRAKGKGK